MPQMAPLNWLTLLVLFSIMFYLFIILNYFIIKYTSKNKNSKINKKNINWKW